MMRMPPDLLEARDRLQLSLQHSSLFTLEELVEKAETFTKTAKKAIATERRNTRKAA